MGSRRQPPEHIPSSTPSRRLVARYCGELQSGDGLRARTPPKSRCNWAHAESCGAGCWSPSDSTASNRHRMRDTEKGAATKTSSSPGGCSRALTGVWCQQVMLPRVGELVHGWCGAQRCGTRHHTAACSQEKRPQKTPTRRAVRVCSAAADRQASLAARRRAARRLFDQECRQRWSCTGRIAVPLASLFSSARDVGSDGLREASAQHSVLHGAQATPPPLPKWPLNRVRRTLLAPLSSCCRAAAAALFCPSSIRRPVHPPPRPLLTAQDPRFWFRQRPIGSLESILRSALSIALPVPSFVVGPCSQRHQANGHA